MVHLVTEVNQEVISLIIFPILLFQTSFAANWHTLKKGIWQVAILSVSVMAMNTIFTAIAVKYILGYSFAWKYLFLIGAILSSTDSIIMDTLLKEVYASDVLETLICGESIINGSIVLLVFEIIFDHSEQHGETSEVIIIIVRLALGGFAIGILFALAMGLVIKRFLNDLISETNICLITAYLLYWICEKSIYASGGISIVTYGLYVSAYGGSLISPEIVSKLKSFLLTVSRNVEAVVFLLSGVIFANTVIYESETLESFDYIALIIIFLLLYVIRGISLLLHYPLLKGVGVGISLKDFVPLWCAGIKGPISLCLSVILINSNLSDKHFCEVALYLTVGVVFLSIFFGSIFFKLSIKLLGLEDLSDVQENMLLGVTQAIVEASDKKIDHLHREKDTQLVNWDEVLKIAGPSLMILSVIKNVKAGTLLLKEFPQGKPEELLKKITSKFTLNKEAILIEMRRRYLSTLKGVYWSFYKEGMCHSDTATILIDSCDICLDSERAAMDDWTAVQSMVYSISQIKLYNKLSKLKFVGSIFRKLLYKQIILAYDATQNFIKGHNETEELIDKMEIDIDKMVFEDIIKESELQMKLCEKFLSAYIIDCYPEVIVEVQTKRSCKVLLYFQQKMTEKIYEQGLIKDLEHETLRDAIESSIRAVTFKGLPSLPVLRDIFVNRFAGAENSEISYLISKITESKYMPGSVVFTQGEAVTGAYYIIRGRVNEKANWVDQELIIGNIVGVQYLLEEFSEVYLSTAQAITDTILAHIPKEVLNMEGFISDFYKEASEEILLLSREKYGLRSIDEKYITRFAETCSVVRYRKGKKAVFLDGAIVLNGKIHETQKSAILKPSKKLRIVSEDSIVMVFPEGFSLSFFADQDLENSITRFCVKNNKTVQAVKEIGNEEIGNMTESYLDDSLALVTAIETKGSLSFKRRTVVPVHIEQSP